MLFGIRTTTQFMCLLFLLVGLCGCVTPQGGGSAMSLADSLADQTQVKEVVYQNADRPGPMLIVLPGSIKSANATFTQKYTANNIADFGEIELGRANFKVLERGDLGPLVNEITLAANMGDAASLKKFKRGKFRSTRWFVRFDILKAEPAASAANAFNGRAVGSLISTLSGYNRGGTAAGTVVSSVGSSEAAQVWTVGLRYKVLDAATTEQVDSGYIEDKMKIGATATSFMGISQGQKQAETLDSLVQRLVQRAVAKIDMMKGPATVKKAVAVKEPEPAPEPEETEKQAAIETSYTVVSGDTLGHIAKRHNTSVKAVMEANSLKNHMIRVGQKLNIPAGN